MYRNFCVPHEKTRFLVAQGCGASRGRLCSLALSLSPSHPLFGKLSIFGQLWQFLSVRKQWWLLPLLVLITLLALFLVFAQGSALAPLIYTVF